MVAAKQAAPALWEQIMQKLRTRYQYPMSDFAREHYFRGHAEGAAQGEIKGEIKGKLEGEARAILAVLEARAIPVDDTTRARILAMTDPDLLGRWIALAVRCAAVEELFVEPAAK